jgi:hypothetical protein
MRAVIAGNDRHDSLKGARFRNVEFENIAVTYRTSQDTSDQSIVVVKIGGIPGTPRNFINSID